MLEVDLPQNKDVATPRRDLLHDAASRKVRARLPLVEIQQLARTLQVFVTTLGGNSREKHFGVGIVGYLFFVAGARCKEFAGVFTPHGCTHR